MVYQKSDKFLENNSETNSEISEENTENSKKPNDKDLASNSGDENKIQKEAKSLYFSINFGAL